MQLQDGAKRRLLLRLEHPTIFPNFPLDSPVFPRETVGVSETAYLSLGSNLGDRAANLRAALAQLNAAGPLAAVSAFYETQPVDVPDQPWFLNCVAVINTDKSPRELTCSCSVIESSTSPA
jgi:hypothetical protein